MLLVVLVVSLCLARGEGVPHIIHIMADDTGHHDLGYKNGLPVSPRIDKLAKEGVQIRNHHAFKVCAPSRCSFHTGRLPWQMGYYDNSGAATPWAKVQTEALGASLDFKLLPELLKLRGYESHAIGKWHLGHVTRAYTPTYRGYSSFLGYYNAMTEDYWTHSHSSPDCPGPLSGGMWSDMSDNTGTHLSTSADNSTFESTLFGDRAVQIIERHNQSKPLFMYLAFHNEHDPHDSEKEDIDHFENNVKSDTYKVTAALLSSMDYQIGRVVDALQKTGMLANTVIGFSSDNGGPLDHANNWPHRGGKHTFYEGGVRTEAFVWSPLLPPSHPTTFDGLMHVADWRATYAMGVAGISASEIATLDHGPFGGESQNMWNAILAGSSTGPRTTLAHNVHSAAYPGNCSISTWQSRNCPMVITEGDLKLIKGFAGDPRRIPLNETPSGPIPFGRSGGKCNLDGFASRCHAPGYSAHPPKPTPEDKGGCLHGCLFNLSADVTESTNLYTDPQHADDVQRLEQKLAMFGKTAPAWFQAPEVAHMSNKDLYAALCQAAHKSGGIQPLDF